MRLKSLGCLTAGGATAAFITAVVIVLSAFVSNNGIFSSGPLHENGSGRVLGNVRSHSELTRQCSACHTAFWQEQGMSDRCLLCHVEIKQEIGTPQSLHALLQISENCQSCHTEHLGADAALTLYETIHFPHDLVGFSLLAHGGFAAQAALSCPDCHPSTVSAFDAQQCLECHLDLNQRWIPDHLAWTGPSCLSCHDGIDRYGQDFDHNQTAYPLEGAHLQTSCGACHPQPDSPESLRSAPSECFACHAADNPHGTSFGLNCNRCHHPADWKPSDFNHDQTQFPLLDSHAPLPCIACHNQPRPLTPNTQCIECHAKDDPHAGGLGDHCGQCHQPSTWEDAGFDHEQTAFPLLDSHAVLRCNACHEAIPLQELSSTCYACHAEQDAHLGGYSTQCDACHKPTNWLDAFFDHNKSQFPLTGGHLGLSCANCHQDDLTQGLSPSCDTCHADPAYHAGLFTQSCDTCHDTSRWTPASFPNQHSFPYNHGGTSSNCATCHPSSLHTYTCYGCHEHSQAKIESKHREEGINNLSQCVRCHPAGREADDD